MSFWQRWLAPKTKPNKTLDDEHRETPATCNDRGADPLSAEIAAGASEIVGPAEHGLRTLRTLQLQGGPSISEALSALRDLLGGPHEAAALRLVVSAAEQGAAPEPLRVAAAEVAVVRGENDRAHLLLTHCASDAAQLVLAELLAARGDTEGACAALGRVLAHDIDAPGVRDRLMRLRGRSGGDDTPAMRDAPTLLLAAPEANVPFQLRREVGRGGAASVYEAYDALLDRTLALKLFYRPREQRVLIEREAREAVNAAGQNVVRVFDADVRAGWIALEWAAGGSLRDVLGQGTTWPRESLTTWFPLLVRALARVHGAGVVHGDVKPANILFRDARDPLVSDFGLARRVGQAWAGGTVGYLSTERLAGATAALDDDVYALGRIVEDVVGGAGSQTPFAAVVRLCLAPRGARPHDASLLHRDAVFRRAFPEG